MGKSTLASLLRGCGPGLLMCEHLEPTGDIVFSQRPQAGCEGIVSKRLARHVSDRTRRWLKFKNPAAPAVRREADEDWADRETSA
jgi:ATP-dependent DNA ligase